MKKVFSKKNVFIITSCVIVILILAIIFTAISIKKSKTCRVAFYGIEEETVKIITDEIKAIKDKNISFTVLDNSSPLPFNVSSSYSILFSYNGKALKNISKKTKNIFTSNRNLFPKQIASYCTTDENIFMTPILLDHVELDIYKVITNEKKLSLPESYEEYKEYLYTIKDETPYPLFTNGGNDKALLDFVSVMASSVLTADEYDALIKELSESFEKTKKLPASLTKVLDEIKSLQSTQLIHKHWYQASLKDVSNFMEWKQLGSTVMRLSEHRKKPLMQIKYYDSILFPGNSSQNFNRKVICPTICAVAFNDKNSEKEIINALIKENVQDILSLETGLAPSTLRAPAADRQADDVRFWAASSKGGIKSSLDEEAFSKPSVQKELAKAIRNYLL